MSPLMLGGALCTQRLVVADVGRCLVYTVV